MFTLCLRLMGDRDVAADMTQETFIKAVQGISSFDQRARLGTWLYRIATNACLSELRTLRHRTRARGEGAPHPDGLNPSSPQNQPDLREPEAASRVQREDLRSQLLEGLARVNEEHRAILVLRDVRGLDYGQIASVLGIASGTVRSRLFRARAALRKELAALAEDPSETH